jgi:hypothetical protein
LGALEGKKIPEIAVFVPSEILRGGTNIKALSIRQPWAFFILCDKPWAKDVENREWPAPKEMIGANFQIYAAKTMTKQDFDAACDFALKAGVRMLPEFDELKRGGIVGVVRLVKCVRLSTSPWFQGRFGFVLAEPYPIPFVPCPGQLNFFEPLAI